MIARSLATGLTRSRSTTLQTPFLSSIRAFGASRTSYPQHDTGMPVPYYSERTFLMADDEYNPPSSQDPKFPNRFVQVKDTKDLKSASTAEKFPAEDDVCKLVDSHAGDPHQHWGFEFYRYNPYSWCREPIFPRKPDLSKGELAAGANVVRTDVWKTPNEPAITSVARFAPDNFQAVGYAENTPFPDSTNCDGHLDFRHNRLPIGHADRRPFIYFASAMGVAFTLTTVRTLVCAALYTWWPNRGVFAASTVEIDLRQIRPGQNFIAKFREKPLFVKRRTEEQIALAQRDDEVVSSLRDPETDGDRCPKPEWLVMVGVCTHLGCIPYSDAGEWNGYFCPCHGSHYDHSGRIRKGPAPKNMEVPKYTFLDDVTIKVG